VRHLTERFGAGRIRPGARPRRVEALEGLEGAAYEHAGEVLAILD
jgi:hypothetical protein